MLQFEESQIFTRFYKSFPGTQELKQPKLKENLRQGEDGVEKKLFISSLQKFFTTTFLDLKWA